MAEQVKDTPEVEVKTPTDTPTEQKEETVGEVMDKVEPKKDIPKPETVGLDKFLELKKEAKEQKKLIKDLEERIASGESKEDIIDDMDSLAEEYNVDKKFLGKLVKAVKSSTEKDIEERVSSKLKPLEEKEKSERIDKIFTQHYADALERVPEYKDIANANVIKSLSLDPINSKKTFIQLIEETYSKAIVGKRTIESTKPRGGKEPEEIDFKRATSDGAYFEEIMADPQLKKKYNENLAHRINL